PPPVVMLTTASQREWISGRNWANTSGSGVGRPVSGSRACRCRIAAPACAAATAWSAISPGVTGSWSDGDGTWIEPVRAQLTITLRVGMVLRRRWSESPLRRLRADPEPVAHRGQSEQRGEGATNDSVDIVGRERRAPPHETDRIGIAHGKV